MSERRIEARPMKAKKKPRSNRVASDDVLERLTVGEYTITPYGPFCRKGSFWIAHDSGEGMEVRGEKVRDLIHEFYKREL